MHYIWAWVLVCALTAVSALRTRIEHPSPGPTAATSHNRQWFGASQPVPVPVTSSPASSYNRQWYGESQSADHSRQWHGAGGWRGVTQQPAESGGAGADNGAPQWGGMALLVPVTYWPTGAAVTTAAPYSASVLPPYSNNLGEGIDDVIAGSADNIRYARPMPRGGYQYRPRPARPRRRPAPRRPASPVIIRIHRHRIYRD